MNNWNNFKRRSLWQHPLWDKLQKANGRKTWMIETDFASALVVKHEMPFKLNWLEVPRGPLCKDQKNFADIVKKIEELAVKEQSVFVRFSPYDEMNLKDARLKDASSDYHPETSLIMDLTLDEEAILEAMKQKGRYNIKVAERHNVSVEPSDNIDAFYEVLAKTANRDGFGVHPKSYYKTMMETLGENAQLLLATYEDRVIAGGIFVYLDEWGIYYYGASEYNYRNVMASYLVQWTAMKEAKKRGCKYYDFLGIAPEGAKSHPWLGVTSFKKKFGGEVVNYPKAKELVLRPFWFFVYKVRKMLG
ncbi:peptidoglycan bridge formation glycyltransferase FemA/FemB family protein [Candidatus Peregrinibacteria bacterium]|nr:peptidoglycan bridge formation glycyltransferase FemA/FemB family protein [Candidatus Peregrinibacteria bacterium]